MPALAAQHHGWRSRAVTGLSWRRGTAASVWALCTGVARLEARLWTVVPVRLPCRGLSPPSYWFDEAPVCCKAEM